MVWRTQWCESYCPRCKKCEETHLHLFHCQHPQSQMLYRKALDDMLNWLTSQHIPDVLTLDLLNLITEWRQYGKISTESSLLSPPIQEQLRLGWHHLMEGRLSVSFTKYMQEYYEKRNIRKTSLSWTAGFISKLWAYLYWPEWTNRNEFVHKLNSEVSQTRRREEMEIEAQLLFKSEIRTNLLQKNQYLLDDPLTVIFELPDAQLQAWINQFRVAVIERNRIFIPENDQASSHLRTWLQSSLLATSKQRVGSN